MRTEEGFRNDIDKVRTRQNRGSGAGRERASERRKVAEGGGVVVKLLPLSLFLNNSSYRIRSVACIDNNFRALSLKNKSRERPSMKRE